MRKSKIWVLKMFNNGYSVSIKWKVFNKKWEEVWYKWNRGYQIVSVSIDWSKYPILVHTFIAYIKYGDDVFKEWIVVRHLDWTKDNRLNNIAIGTISDNRMDIPKEDRVLQSSKTRIYDHKMVLELSKSWKSYTEIMWLTWIKSKWSISYIINQSLTSQWVI